ncbi:MAG TPA: lysozyme inhibitor LprI family protein [Acidiphilium sp.]
MRMGRFLGGYAILLTVPLLLATTDARANIRPVDVQTNITTAGSPMSGSTSGSTLTEQCGSYRTAYDRTYCVTKLFLKSDQELNTVYGKLESAVAGDTRQGLVQVQRDWIRYRDHACEAGAGSIDVVCSYHVNHARTDYLRDRLRECKAGHCDKTLIVRKSW